MSTTKHTPGPWRWYAPSEQGEIRKNAKSYMPTEAHRIAGNIKAGGRYVGLLIKSHPNEPDPTRADLDLIAAAPDLLRAAEAYMRAFELHQITNAGSSDVDATGFITEIARAAIAKALGEKA